MVDNCTVEQATDLALVDTVVAFAAFAESKIAEPVEVEELVAVE